MFYLGKLYEVGIIFDSSTPVLKTILAIMRLFVPAKEQNNRENIIVHKNTTNIENTQKLKLNAAMKMPAVASAIIAWLSLLPHLLLTLLVFSL